MVFRLSEHQGARIRSVTIYGDTAVEVTTTAPSAHYEELKLSPEERDLAREIAFSDPQVQQLAEGKEYAVAITRADGMVRPLDEPPDDDIEVKLVFDRDYMIEDITASALNIFVDIKEGVVTYLFPLGTSGMPELTESVREEAISIALNDAGIQQELAGRPYTIGRVGITMGGPLGRLGANVLFVFDEPYPLEPQAPMAPERHQTGVVAFVNLEEGKVVQVIAESAPVDPFGGE